MNNIIAIKDNIIFQFVEDVTSTRFINSSKAGLIISSKDGNQTSIPRWGKATHVGPDVRDVSVNDYILIEAGKWTSGFYVDGVRYWKTDEAMVMGISDEPSTTY
jgi:hypothetical protein